MQECGSTDRTGGGSDHTGYVGQIWIPKDLSLRQAIYPTVNHWVRITSHFARWVVCPQGYQNRLRRPQQVQKTLPDAPLLPDPPQNPHQLIDPSFTCP